MTGYYPTLGFDPAPGDVGAVENWHRTVSHVADRLSTANGALSRLGRSDGVWQGQTAQAFARRVGELPKHLTDGENLMSAACRALSTWWNSWFGNTLDNVKKGWNVLNGHGSFAALGATFVNGVGGAQTRRSGGLAPA